MPCLQVLMVTIGRKFTLSPGIGESSYIGPRYTIARLVNFFYRAQICRAKAIDWKTRNPANPAHLQLRLESLKRMEQAYQVYKDVSNLPALLRSFMLCDRLTISATGSAKQAAGANNVLGVRQNRLRNSEQST